VLTEFFLRGDIAKAKRQLGMLRINARRIKNFALRRKHLTRIKYAMKIIDQRR